MAKTKKKKPRDTEDENIIAAHQALEDSATKVAKAADVLMRRIEDLGAELAELQQSYDTDLAAAREELRQAEKRHVSELAALERKHASELATAEKTREREVAGLKADLAKRETELLGRIAALEEKLGKFEDKFRQVQLELA